MENPRKAAKCMDFLSTGEMMDFHRKGGEMGRGSLSTGNPHTENRKCGEKGWGDPAKSYRETLRRGRPLTAAYATLSQGRGSLAHRRANRLTATVAAANRGTSSKSPRCIRHWRCFADFPARGRGRAPSLRTIGTPARLVCLRKGGRKLYPPFRKRGKEFHLRETRKAPFPNPVLRQIPC